jgi:protocatechuate 3,4-dioxygenase beta subunit
MRSCSAFLLSAAAMLAQPPPSEAPKTARLEGVVRSTAGQPIARASVRLQGPAAPQSLPTNIAATTDEEGKFVFDGVPPGRNYRLSAQRPGFVNAQYGARGPNQAGTPLTLTAGQVLKDLQIEMIPQGVISGRVTDRNGDPVASAQVIAVRSAIQRGARQFVPGGAAATNDQGEYRIANLPPGRYYLSVSERNALLGAVQRTAGAAAQETNLTTYYANSPDLRSAVPIDITAGAELRGIDVRLLRGRAYSIRGRILDPNGAPPAGQLLLNAVPKEEGNSPSLVTALSGRALQPTRPPDHAFEFSGLTPGTYVISAATQATVNGQPAAPLWVRAEVTIADKDVNDLVIRASAGATLAGTVRLEGGEIQSLLPPDPAKPGAAPAGLPAGVVVAVAAANILTPVGRPSVTLAEISSTPLGGARPGQLQPDGSFKLEGVGPSRFRVNVTALPDGVYVKSVTFGGQNITNGVLDLTSGAGGSLDIVLSSKAADITGVVRNDKGEAVASAPVSLWPRTPPAGDPLGGMRAAVADQNGGFQFRSLPPGEYYLAAWDHPEATLMMGGELLSKFTGDAAKIELSESAHTAIEVKLIPEGKIAAEVAKLP